MKKAFTIFSLFALISSQSFAQQVKQLTADEFEKGTAVPPDNVQVLDVRTAGEYQSGHLKHALQADWNNQAQFKERTAALNKSKPVYVYCLSGGRSAAAAQWLQQQGYTNVLALKGGINSWKQSGKPIEATVAVAQMNMADYNNLIKGNDTYLVDFGAEWCPPCKKMEPVLRDLEKQTVSKFKLIKVDGGVHTNVMTALKVTGIPTFIIYKNGKETWRKEGIVTIEELKAAL
jgi:rhodanese-related sulfurtransferase